MQSRPAILFLAVCLVAPSSSLTSPVQTGVRASFAPRRATTALPQSVYHPRLSTGSSVRPTARSPAPILALRGGLAGALVPATVTGGFNLAFGVLSLACAALVAGTRERSADAAEEIPAAAKKLQWQFLIVFWLYKMADWLQGPYFYEVYASKVINGVAVSTQGVAKLFLTGFGSTALFGAVVGGLVDSLGRKRGSLAFALMYAISALSTRCGTLPLLLAGRVAGGIGTSLLFSAPEAWLVSEQQRSGIDGKYLSRIFGLAYFGDAIVAILAGQIAGVAAAARGPTAPFEISTLFLAAGAALVFFGWKENFGGKAAAVDAGGESTEEGTAVASDASAPSEDGQTMVKDAFAAMLEDRRILLLGAVQALFEVWSSPMHAKHIGMRGMCACANGLLPLLEARTAPLTTTVSCAGCNVHFRVAVAARHQGSPRGGCGSAIRHDLLVLHGLLHAGIYHILCPLAAWRQACRHDGRCVLVAPLMPSPGAHGPYGMPTPRHWV